MTNPIYCALDTGDEAQALDLAKKLLPHVGGFKLGLEFFAAHGAPGVRAIAALGRPIFLDLKFHDIPNTVAGAIKSLATLAPAMTTIHASGGTAMVKAAVAAAAESSTALGLARPLILAVTVLTSTAEGDLSAVGVTPGLADQVKRLAALAQNAGADGVVASAHEIEGLRAQCGPAFKLVIPGIRPAWAETHDQKRVLSPAEALARGADCLVIGRPITASADPAAAARRILSEIGTTP